MNIRSGSIPVEIVYVLGEKTTVTSRWDNTFERREQPRYTEVVPVSVFGAGDQTKIKKAVKQAASASMSFIDTPTLKLENKPMTGLRILNREFSGSEKVYKVLNLDGLFFEIHDDVLLETMLNSGIKPNGVLEGEFLWASINNEMKLVRKDSELFDVLLETGDREFLSFIEKNSLKVGGIYESRRGEKLVFLGHAVSETWRFEWLNNKNVFFNTMLFTGDKPFLRKKNVTLLLWVEIPPFASTNNEITLRFLTKNLESTLLHHTFTTTRSSTVIRKLGELPVPENVIEIVRKMSVETYKLRIKHGERKLRELPKSKTTSDFYDFRKITLDAVTCCLMRKPDGSQPTVDEPHFQQLQSMTDKEVEIRMPAFDC
jgi:hypothetical protein